MCTIHKNAYYFNSMAHKSSVSFDTSTSVTCAFETNAENMIQCIRHTIDMVIILLLRQYQYGLGLRIPHTSKKYNLSYLTFVFCSFWKLLMHVDNVDATWQFIYIFYYIIVYMVYYRQCHNNWVCNARGPPALGISKNQKIKLRTACYKC